MTPRSRLLTIVASVLAAVTLCSVVLLVKLSSAAMHNRFAGRAPALITILPGADLSSVAHTLAVEGIVNEPLLFELWTRLAGRAGALQAGTYEVAPAETPAALLEKMVAGRTKTFTVTFVEGSRFSDLRRVLRAHPHLLHTIQQLSDEAVMDTLGVTDRAAEGLFFPSTYQFKADAADITVLARAHQRMQQLLAAGWQSRAPDLPYDSPYAALVMALIVEKETARADERRMIAGVFVRRLRKGMKLQTDPTVIYGLGNSYAGNLRRADLQHDTAYNTYTRAGLPPTPIAMPGAASIAAALDPLAGTALYFVARGDGSHQFSDSLEQHISAVQHYQVRSAR